MKHYEILYLFPAKYTEEELQPLVDKVLGMITKAEGKITFNQLLGRRKLAYPIKNYYSGYYFVCEFDLDPTKLNKLNSDLTLSPEVLRQQIIAKEKVATGLSEALISEAPVNLEPAPVEVKEVKKSEPAPKLDMADLDKKLEEILEEKVD